MDAVGMAPRYRVTLTEEERRDLEALTRSGKTNGSSLFSVGGRDFQFARCEVKHGNEVVGGTKSPSLAFDG